MLSKDLKKSKTPKDPSFFLRDAFDIVKDILIFWHFSCDSWICIKINGRTFVFQFRKKKFGRLLGNKRETFYLKKNMRLLMTN